MISIAKEIATASGRSSPFKVSRPGEVAIRIVGYTAGTFQLDFWSPSTSSWEVMSSVEASESGEQYSFQAGIGYYSVTWTGVSGTPGIDADGAPLTDAEAGELS